MTQAEVDSVITFLSRKIKNGGADLTLEDCLQQWRDEQERAEVISAVQRGVDDMAAGRWSTLEDADREMRRKLGLKSR